MSAARMIWSAIALVVAISAPALAQRTGSPPPEIALGTTLVTPPLLIGPGYIWGGNGEPAGSCQVVNVGATDVMVSVRIFDINGNEIGEPGYDCKRHQVLAPNAGCNVWIGSGFGGIGIWYAYCKITVVGAKESVRGALTDLSQVGRGTVAAQ